MSIEEKIIDLKSFASREGLTVGAISLPPIEYMQLSEELGYKVQYVDLHLSEAFAVCGILLTTANGEIVVTQS